MEYQPIEIEDRSSLRSNGLIRSTISRTHGTYPRRASHWSKILSTGYVLWRLDRWGGSLTKAFNIISVQIDLFDHAIRSPPTLFFPSFPWKRFETMRIYPCGCFQFEIVGKIQISFRNSPRDFFSQNIPFRRLKHEFLEICKVQESV